MPDSAPPLFGPNVIDEGRQGLVGAPVDRVDGPLKVSGRAVYAYEYAGEAEAAYGYILGAPIAKGVDLGVKQGLAVGEPARALGMDPKDMGKVINWKAEKIDKLVSATDF